MLIGIPKEIKVAEYRIGATPAVVKALKNNGHEVLVETGAGAMIGYTDGMFLSAGAKIVPTPFDVYQAEMIVKVKEPQCSEYPLLRRGQILFCYLHLAPDPIQTESLLKQGVIGIAYETVTDSRGTLPLLEPMSEIAGRVSIQVAAHLLQMNEGGKGLLLGGVPGVLPAKVVVLGGGTSGTEAARMAIGLGADVTVLDIDLQKIHYLDMLFSPRIKTLYSSPLAIEEQLKTADVVIGSVLIKGKRAPRLISKEMLKLMSPKSVLIDIAIDQGGCFETSTPTTHENPTYVVDQIIHYCVTNMPGVCARTATQALTNATMKYILNIANKGVKLALQEDVHLQNGLNVCLGKVTIDLGGPYEESKKVIELL